MRQTASTARWASVGRLWLVGPVGLLRSVTHRSLPAPTDFDRNGARPLARSRDPPLRTSAELRAELLLGLPELQRELRPYLVDLEHLQDLQPDAMDRRSLHPPQ